MTHLLLKKVQVCFLIFIYFLVWCVALHICAEARVRTLGVFLGHFLLVEPGFLTEPRLVIVHSGESWMHCPLYPVLALEVQTTNTAFTWSLHAGIATSLSMELSPWAPVRLCCFQKPPPACASFLLGPLPVPLVLTVGSRASLRSCKSRGNFSSSAALLSLSLLRLCCLSWSHRRLSMSACI